jgi:hypothetical protein
VAHTVIVASIFHPQDIEWNLQSKDNLDQLLDRFEIKKLEGPNRRKPVLGPRPEQQFAEGGL